MNKKTYSNLRGPPVAHPESLKSESQQYQEVPQHVLQIQEDSALIGMSLKPFPPKHTTTGIYQSIIENICNPVALFSSIVLDLPNIHWFHPS